MRRSTDGRLLLLRGIGWADGRKVATNFKPTGTSFDFMMRGWNTMCVIELHLRGSEATKVDQLKNCRAKTIVKGGRQGRQSNAFCISCFSLLFLLHFNSFSFTWELLFWIVNCPSRESRSEINLANLNSVRSVVDTRERKIDEWSQKSQLKLNAECITAQYSKFLRIWFSHFSSLSSSVDCSST